MRIAVIRLKGKFSLSPRVNSALSSIKLDRLYSCALLPDNAASRGMVRSCKDAVSFGQVGKDSIAILLSKRGKTPEGKRLSLVKKPDEIAKMASEIESSEKKLVDFGMAPVFFLSPPVGGFGSKKETAPFGLLGKNQQMPELIKRMA